MRIPLLLACALAFSPLAKAADIIWISDQLPIGSGATDHDGGTSGIFGPGAGPYPDEGIISLLTGAGHTVTRFNPSNSTALNAADIAALNLADLLIIGRSIASGSFDTAGETLPWNTQITTPLMVTNSYISRSSRLGWFTGGPTQPDVVVNNLTFTNPTEDVSEYIIGNVALNGSTTVNSATEAVIYPDNAVDIRGISLITDPLVAGGFEIATSTATTPGDATFIASWPAGTTLAGTSVGQVLAGYRMQFLVGNRESATAPNNQIGSAGFENLTPDGQGMFLRAVDVAVNNGVVPIPEPSVLGLVGLSGLSILLRRRR